jgi:O-methyltransferase
MLSRQKLYLMMKLLSQAIKLPGDVLEAGAGSGGSARLMVNCLADSKITKHMWLLDTFAGYQKVDTSKDGQHVHLNDCKCSSKEEVERLLTDQAATVHIIQGLIPGTLEQVKADKLCFAHIDVNLYEPTLTATDFVLRRLVHGGIVLFDDYCWPATYGARRAIDEVCANHRQEIICVPESTQAFLIKN